jgi:hypothetical protein
MRKFTRLTLSTMVLITATSPAFADPSGFVGGEIGRGTVNFGSGDQSADYASLRGTLGMDLTPAFSLQGDLVYTFIGSGSFQSYDFGGALHLSRRLENGLLLGGIVQYDHYIDREKGTYESDRTLAGIEAQYALDRITLYGQAGGLAYLNPDDSAYHQYGLFATAQLRYFLTDDLRIDLRAAAIHTEMHNDPDYGTGSIAAGLGVEYRINESPVSLTANADYYRFTTETNNDVREDARFTVGLRFNFGNQTLLERDRSGPSLDPVAHYPFFFNGAD